MSALGQLPLACIYQPAPSPTRSAPGRREWVLEFERSSPPGVDPLMGWIGSRDPFAHIRLAAAHRLSVGHGRWLLASGGGLSAAWGALAAAHPSAQNRNEL